MARLGIAGLGLLLSWSLLAFSGGQTTFDPISAEELEGHIEVLADDAMEGREAGTEGEVLAAEYIVEQLEALDALEPGGVDGTWYQPFTIPGAEDRDARNVIALLPGRDPGLSHQTIILGAHYDHVGRGEQGSSLDLVNVGQIHNGADDNASGSSALLEIAEALATSPVRPRRTISFQWYSGEEMGLKGSRHYTAYPLRPLEDTVLMINMDMIGRLVGRTLTVGGTGTAPDVLPAMVAEECAELGIVLKEERVGAAPSDNASFYLRGVPSLFLFTGVHEDYHRSTDDVDKVNAAGAADVARLALALTRAMDERDDPLDFERAPGQAEYWMPKPFFGAVFVDAGDEDVGRARINFVFEGSPAALAGLRVGDQLLMLDGETPEDASAVERALALDGVLDRETFALRPVTFRVVRGADDLESAEILDIEVQPLVH